MPLLAPILAQLITLNLGARNEALYIAPTSNHYLDDSRALVALRFGWQHSQLTLTYTPSLILANLGSPPIERLLSHTVGISSSTEISRAIVTVSEVAVYGQVDPTISALSGGQLDPTNSQLQNGGGSGAGAGGGSGPGSTGTAPGTGAGAGSGPGAAQPLVLSRVLRVESSTTTAALAYQFSLADTAGVSALYSIGGGADASSRTVSPVFESVRLGVSWQKLFTPADTVTSVLASTYGWSADGTSALITGVTELWMHAFSAMTSGRLGAGVAVTRGTPVDGASQNSVYPTIDAALAHSEPLARGMLAMSVGASTAPVIDPISGAIDPRLGFTGALGWSKEKFAIGAFGTASVSVAGAGNQGAQDFAGAELRTSYQLTPVLSVDGGLRGAWQVFQSQTVVPPSYAIFVGVSVGGSVHVSGH
ncbi:MAG: hypothetical protein ABI548_14600 [Polyangiaceae bacterium]